MLNLSQLLSDFVETGRVQELDLGKEDTFREAIQQGVSQAKSEKKLPPMAGMFGPEMIASMGYNFLPAKAPEIFEHIFVQIDALICDGQKRLCALVYLKTPETPQLCAVIFLSKIFEAE
ncbi:MAG: hypothetical protein QXR53_05090 [Candidatus Norongarragalinales archaeon]